MERGVDQLHMGALDVLMVLCTLHAEGASICVLDEATRSVYPSGRAVIRDYLWWHAKNEGKTILVITHNSELVTELTLENTIRFVRNEPGEEYPGRTGAVLLREMMSNSNSAGSPPSTVFLAHLRR
jgi:ABC-type uncharacterized transport system ATPase subunit